jgi:hypothetical protein
MKPKEIEEELIRLHGKEVSQDYEIGLLKEEIHQLKIQIEKKYTKVFQYSKDYRSPVNSSRAIDVYKQFKAKNNGKIK